MIDKQLRLAILRDAAGGLSEPAIAIQHNTSRAIVHRVLRTAGYPDLDHVRRHIAALQLDGKTAPATIETPAKPAQQSPHQLAATHADTLGGQWVNTVTLGKLASDQTTRNMAERVESLLTTLRARVADDQVSTATMRRWALENGWKVSQKGTLPADVRQAYLIAHAEQLGA